MTEETPQSTSEYAVTLTDQFTSDGEPVTSLPDTDPITLHVPFGVDLAAETVAGRLLRYFQRFDDGALTSALHTLQMARRHEADDANEVAVTWDDSASPVSVTRPIRLEIAGLDSDRYYELVATLGGYVQDPTPQSGLDLENTLSTVASPGTRIIISVEYEDDSPLAGVQHHITVGSHSDH